MPTQTGTGKDDCEEKDCKTVNMDLSFISHQLCFDNTPIDVVIANVVQDNSKGGPYTVEISQGMPDGMSLVMVGSAVRLQGLYSEPIASSSGTAYFRVNDVDGCCVCGGMSWGDTLQGSCPSPWFKELNFGGSEVTCLGVFFQDLPP